MSHDRRLTTTPQTAPAHGPRLRSRREHLYRLPHWFACRTRPRAEKKAERQRDRAGIEAFLPLVYRERQWADRTKVVGFPLFPGYLFARFHLREMAAVLQLPLLSAVVATNGVPTPVRDEEIDAVRKLVDRARQTGIEPQPADFLEPGEEIVVVDGPFRGLHGVLLEHRGSTRVAVKLSAIRQAVAIELDRKCLRAASTGGPAGQGGA